MTHAALTEDSAVPVGLDHPSGAGRTAGLLAARPRVERVPSAAVDLFLQRQFLDEAECAVLVRMIDQKRRPSTIADDNGDPGFRTSETCDMDRRHLVVAALDQRIGDLTGLDPAYGEPVQGQRYDVGQEFKAHTDYFDPTGADFSRYCSVAGNRTWTVMIYLNDVEAGGATHFTAIDVTIRPERGMLLAWDNRRRDGEVNPDTLHHGTPVQAGVKHIVTKWFRERPWG
jgi:prolyl 4-hydroxylase